MKVVIGKGVKRISLQRYLVTKIVILPERVMFMDIVALYENQLWLERKAVTDATFKEKFGSSLEVLSFYLKGVNVSQGFAARSLKRLSDNCKVGLEDFLVPERNFPQWRSRFGSVVTLHTQQPLGTPNRLIAPKGFIGKGYGDKGTARNEQTDASPPWQEVARADHRINEILRTDFSELSQQQRDELAEELRQERSKVDANLDRGRDRVPERPTAQAKRR